MTNYKIRIYTPAGILQDEITDFLSLSYNKVVNDAGLLSFSLDGSHKSIQYLINNAQLEVWRRDLANSISWYADFYGLFKDEERTYSEGKSIYTAYVPGINSLLATRINAWTANTASRSKFTGAKAETIMKTLVSYNASSLATAGNGRIRNGAISTITVDTDSARGNTLDWNCAYDNLLETLQSIALVGGGDFDLVKTGSQAWKFYFYLGQLGTDRHSTVIFSLDRGNMAEPLYTKNRSAEKTVAIVGGQGDEVDRTVVVRTGDNYSTSNDVEMFIDARNSDTTNALNAEGDTALKDVKSKDTLDFKVLQTPACLYGKHYFLGDLVTGIYQTISNTIKIQSITVTLDSDGRETIDVGLQVV